MVRFEGTGISITPQSKPLVSVIIPTHKRAPKLPAAIAAINDQQYDNIELIVVYTPEEETERLLESISDLDINITLIGKRTAGVSEARNIGINASNGKIIAFTDDDCIPPREWVTRIVAILEKYDVVTTGGLNPPHSRVDDRLAAQIDCARLHRNQLPLADEQDENGVATGDIQLRTFGTANVAYLADAIKETSTRFDTNLDRGEDADFQRKILDRTSGRNAYLPVPVYHNRDYTVVEFLHQRYQNGIGEAQTEYGRTVSGSVLGIIASPVLLLKYTLQEDSKRVAIGSWIGDITARVGTLRGSLK